MRAITLFPLCLVMLGLLQPCRGVPVVDDAAPKTISLSAEKAKHDETEPLEVTTREIGEAEGEGPVEAVKREAFPTTDPTGCYSYGASYPANTIAWQSEVRSAPECQRLCSRSDNCAHFIYRHSSGDCWLRTEIGEQERQVVADPSDGMVFGPSLCPGESREQQQKLQPPQTSDQTYEYLPVGADIPVGPYTTYRRPAPMGMPAMAATPMGVPYDSFDAWMDSFFSPMYFPSMAAFDSYDSYDHSMPLAYRTPVQYAGPIRGYVRTDAYTPTPHPTMEWNPLDMEPSATGDNFRRTSYNTPKSSAPGQGSSGTGDKRLRTPSPHVDTFSWNSMRCVKTCSDNGRSCSMQCQ
eukprot:GHVU01163786.1.p1 GENE.GHVU01163786.1~~GHVU01163786.1.p1  ORF type:complete len:351 (+),score=38.56 GHVU01163786.1:230-1282(+)